MMIKQFIESSHLFRGNKNYIYRKSRAKRGYDLYSCSYLEVLEENNVRLIITTHGVDFDTNNNIEYIMNYITFILEKKGIVKSYFMNNWLIQYKHQYSVRLSKLNKALEDLGCKTKLIKITN